MKTVISIHIFPHEITAYDRTVSILNRNIENLKEKISLYVILNLSSTQLDWSNPSFCKSKFKNKFEEINTKLHKNIKLFKSVIDDPNMLGCNHHRQNTYKKFRDYDYIVFLDVDLIFSDSLIKNFIFLVTTHDLPKFSIITPQTLRLWDNTWDCIVNNNYKKYPLNSYKTINIDNVHNQLTDNKISLKSCSTFKFAGGWFTIFKPSILEYIKIPKSFGGYGPDDTFIMCCMGLMRKSGKNVVQYMIENEVVVERPIINDAPKLILSSNQQRNFATKNFHSELLKFTEKL